MKRLFHTDIKIADIPIRITSDAAAKNAFVKKAFREYVTRVSRAYCTIEIIERAYPLPLYQLDRVTIKHDGDRIVLSCDGDDKSVFGIVDITKRRATLMVQEKALRFYVHPFLMFVFSVVCLQKQAIVLHAAAAIEHGHAHVFIGKSGCGKTTIARMLKRRKVKIISDERVVVRRKGARVYAYGFPWYNDKNRCAKVKALYFLKKSLRVDVRLVSHADAIRRMFPLITFTIPGDDLARSVLTTAMNITGSVPVYTLRFLKDLTFWERITRKG